MAAPTLRTTTTLLETLPPRCHSAYMPTCDSASSTERLTRTVSPCVGTVSIPCGTLYANHRSLHMCTSQIVSPQFSCTNDQLCRHTLLVSSCSSSRFSTSPTPPCEQPPASNLLLPDCVPSFSSIFVESSDYRYSRRKPTRGSSSCTALSSAAAVQSLVGAPATTFRGGSIRGQPR